MKLLVAILFILSICACDQQKPKNGKQLKVKSSMNVLFQSTIKLCSGYNTLELEIFKDSIKGKHCFVFGGGERIDCCDDDDYTIFLKKKNSKKWIGTLKSCYKNEKIKVELISITKNKYKLTLKNYDLTSYLDFKQKWQ